MLTRCYTIDPRYPNPTHPLSAPPSDCRKRKQTESPETAKKYPKVTFCDLITDSSNQHPLKEAVPLLSNGPQSLDANPSQNPTPEVLLKKIEQINPVSRAKQKLQTKWLNHFISKRFFLRELPIARDSKEELAALMNEEERVKKNAELIMMAAIEQLFDNLRERKNATALSSLPPDACACIRQEIKAFIEKYSQEEGLDKETLAYIQALPPEIESQGELWTYRMIPKSDLQILLQTVDSFLNEERLQTIESLCLNYSDFLT